MIVKSPILKNRVRNVPKSFSWIDHRLVRDHHVERCTEAELALYLFLICVSDSKGLSFYGDKSIMNLLHMDSNGLNQARSGLIRHNLIAWQRPVYQILSLEPVKRTRRSGTMVSIADILKSAVEARND